ncbi:deoxyribonuclease TATDN1 [Schistosoma japonicum]|nr:deoxyribonuclease TATDN1 [Schistosoma japonicum]
MKRLVDIGANLTDKVFTGVYHGVRQHKSDYQNVLYRARKCGVEKIIITGGSLTDSAEAISLCESDRNLFCTVGCHPTRCLEFVEDPENYLMRLKNLILTTNKVVAVGECGLDYDREEFCPKDIQKKYFDIQLKLASDVNLPLFLHCRAAHEDLLEMAKSAKEKYFQDKPLRGVVHSFDGTNKMAEYFTNMGLYIGINGCSLKNQDNLEVVQKIPIDRLLLETDAPWCDIRRTHAGN